MEKGANFQIKPLKYAKISLQKRQKLISLIEQKSITIAKAARKLGIKLSTAKLILKKFREEGTFFEKRQNKLKRLQALKDSTFINCRSNNQQILPQYPQIYHNMPKIDQYWINNPLYLSSSNFSLGNQQNFYTCFLPSRQEIYAIYYPSEYYQV